MEEDEERRVTLLVSRALMLEKGTTLRANGVQVAEVEIRGGGGDTGGSTGGGGTVEEGEGVRLCSGKGGIQEARQIKEGRAYLERAGAGSIIRGKERKENSTSLCTCSGRIRAEARAGESTGEGRRGGGGREEEESSREARPNLYTPSLHALPMPAGKLAGDGRGDRNDIICPPSLTVCQPLCLLPSSLQPHHLVSRCSNQRSEGQVTEVLLPSKPTDSLTRTNGQSMINHIILHCHSCMKYKLMDTNKDRIAGQGKGSVSGNTKFIKDQRDSIVGAGLSKNDKVINTKKAKGEGGGLLCEQAFQEKDNAGCLRAEGGGGRRTLEKEVLVGGRLLYFLLRVYHLLRPLVYLAPPWRRRNKLSFIDRYHARGKSKGSRLDALVRGGGGGGTLLLETLSSQHKSNIYHSLVNPSSQMGFQATTSNSNDDTLHCHPHRTPTVTPPTSTPPRRHHRPLPVPSPPLNSLLLNPNRTLAPTIITKFLSMLWSFSLIFFLLPALFIDSCDALSPPDSSSSGSNSRGDIQMINGFVLLGFEPQVVELTIGQTVSVSINVSVLDLPPPSAVLTSGWWVWPCCTDPRVATLYHPEPVEVPPNSNHTSILQTSLLGKGLGRTSIRFIIVNNETTDVEVSRGGGGGSGGVQNHSSAAASALPHAPTPSHLLGKSPFSRGPLSPFIQTLTSEGSSSQTWWLPYDYEVQVLNKPDHACFYLSAMVFGLVVINLIGIGGQIDGDMMIYLLKKPSAVGIALLCRFGIIPAVSLGVVELLKPGQDTSLGALVLLCSPAEGASNLFILLAEADLTLSVTITCVTNFAAIGMLPLWTILFETRIYDEPGNVEIPFTDAFVIFGYLITSLTVGFIFHRKCPVKYHYFWTYLPSFTIFTILFTIITEIYNANYVFPIVTTQTFFTAVLLVLVGFGFGAVMAFLSQQTSSRIMVLALESGTRTTYFTTALIVMSLSQPEADIAKATPVLVSLLSLGPTFVLVCLYRMYRRYTGQSYADPDYAPPSSCSDEDLEEEQNIYNEEGMLEDCYINDEYKNEMNRAEKCLPIIEVVDVKETCI